MSADGETRRDGFFGWLFAMLATMSLLPLGITSTSGPSSAKPPAEPRVAEESGAADGDATDADATPATTSLDEAIPRSLGVWKPTKPVKPASKGKGKGKGQGKEKG